jgi:hypothetical protein
MPLNGGLRFARGPRSLTCGLFHFMIRQTLRVRRSTFGGVDERTALR